MEKEEEEYTRREICLWASHLFLHGVENSFRGLSERTCLLPNKSPYVSFHRAQQDFGLLTKVGNAKSNEEVANGTQSTYHSLSGG